MPYKDPEKRKAYFKQWQALNRDKVNAYNVAWASRNTKRVQEYQSEWYQTNKERLKPIRYKHLQANKPQYRARTAKRRAAKLRATPSWVDIEALKSVYGACPEGCEVDHIVPLQGENVSGLHVPWNLQFLPVSENRRKRNKF